MPMKAILTGAALALMLGAAGAAVAADMGAVIQARQAHYKAIGAASKGIYDELNKPTPDANVSITDCSIRCAACRWPM